MQEAEVVVQLWFRLCLGSGGSGGETHKQKALSGKLLKQECQKYGSSGKVPAYKYKVLSSFLSTTKKKKVSIFYYPLRL
jgi:hypothetical protein